jgi:hypothetical protein
MNISYRSSRWPSAGHVLAEVLAGAAGGFLLAVVAGFASAGVFAGAADGWGDLVGAVVGAMIGYTIGASIGVYLAGRRLAGRGSYWLALAGSVLGTALVLLLAEPLRLNASATLMQGTLAVAAPVLSALAFGAGIAMRK